MLVKCNACKGQKKIMCLGFIEGECKECEGTGFVSIEQAIEQEPKKRTRKAKPSLEASFVKLDENNDSIEPSY